MESGIAYAVEMHNLAWGVARFNKMTGSSELWGALENSLKEASPAYVSKEIFQDIMNAAVALPEEIELPHTALTRRMTVWIEHFDEKQVLAGFLIDVMDVGNEHKGIIAVPILKEGPRLRFSLPIQILPNGTCNLLSEIGVEVSSEPTLEEIRYFSVASAFVISFLLWIEQSLIVPRRELVPRHARKRFKKQSIPESLYRVVVLRRASQRRKMLSENKEWQHRWLVKGHWRKIGPDDKKRTTWVHPYIKGPDDKPLKTPKTTVFNVNR